MASKAAEQRLSGLTRLGDNIGAFGTHKPGYYSASLLMDKAEEVRTKGVDKCAAAASCHTQGNG